MDAVKQRKNKLLKIGHLFKSILLMGLMSCSICHGAKSFTISTFDDLEKIRKNPSGCYIMTNDIDGEGKTMDSIKGFTGWLIGYEHIIYSNQNDRHHVIKNIKINGSGLFETMTDARVKNVILDNITVISDKDNVGCLAGIAIATKEWRPQEERRIYQVEVINSTISGRENVGGLVGHNTKVHIYASSVKNTKIIGKGNNIGGLVGANEGSTINGCKLKENKVRGDNLVGGLVGSNTKSVINGCKNSNVIVSGGNRVGGLIGSTYRGKVCGSSVEKTTITGTGRYVGGLVGRNERSTFEGVNIRSTIIRGKVDVGGLIGHSCSWIHIHRASVWEGVEVISATKNAGGLIGRVLHERYSGKSDITDSYSQAYLEAGEGEYTAVGGLIGIMEIKYDGHIEIKNSYCAGHYDKKKRQYSNGVVGSDLTIGNTAMYKKLFWLVSKGRAYWRDGSRLATEKEMKSKKLYIDAGWNSKVWKFEDGKLPILKWETWSDNQEFADDMDGLSL